MAIANSYADPTRARAYSTLGFQGTYHLAFRDLPALFARHVTGRVALDVGCGAGRSTRFLRDCGFDVMGVDIAAEMIERARAIDPDGDYRLVADGDLHALAGLAFDLILCAFPFDNIAARAAKVRLLAQLRGLLTTTGYVVNIVSTPEIYVHEWVSFTTKDFPANRQARTGDPVLIVNTSAGDTGPVHDFLCPDEEYRAIYSEAELEVAAHERPLATGDEPVAWLSETTIAPWSIYVLTAGSRPRAAGSAAAARTT